MYPKEIVEPMKEELTENGFQELLTSGEVDSQLEKSGTTLVMVNSVCGCSAGSARPGVLMAVANGAKKPRGTTRARAAESEGVADSMIPNQFLNAVRWCQSLYNRYVCSV